LAADLYFRQLTWIFIVEYNSLRSRAMNIEILLLIVVSVIWVGAEVYLVLRDNVHEKGKTTIDQRTRNYNFISLIIAISSAAIISWIPVFQFSRRGTSVVFWIGIIIICLGLFLRYWSINVLGRYFRTTVELEENQKIIQKGPYKLIRHPSYSGIILFCLGYGLAVQNWLSLVIAVSLPTVALLYRIKIEEEALVKGMGTEYEAYQKKTKKLIPGIW
jgi:protein-S-isoprenylcysteine O-methyltransferase Ste14